jgi:hypothetical protein
MTPDLFGGHPLALPALIYLVGLALLIAHSSANYEGLKALLGTGWSMLLINPLCRFGITSDRERAHADAAHARVRPDETVAGRRCEAGGPLHALIWDFEAASFDAEGEPCESP